MSTILDTLERRFGRWAIPGLMKYIAILFVGTFLLSAFRPSFVESLDFDYGKILEGEFWRLFTFILAPSAIQLTPLSAIFMFFGTMLLFIFSEALENQWGVFRSNLYIIWGFISSLAANLIFVNTFGYSPGMSGIYLALSILYAFATYNPKFSLLLFFIIPCPIWIIAAFSGFMTIISALSPIHHLLFVLICLSNYLIVVIPILKAGSSAKIRRSRYESRQKSSNAEPFHTCSRCGATDISHPEREFRVSSKDGNTYCTEHLPK